MKISMLSALSVWGKSMRFAGSRASASTAISSRSRCFARGSPSLKARGDRVSIWLRHVRRIHPFLSRSRRIMKPSRPFLKRASAFLLNGPTRLHLLLLGRWKVPPQCAPLVMKMLKVRRQISVGWPGGGASATVSPLLWWSPWRGSSFMEQTVFVPCVLCHQRRSTRLSLMQRHGAIWWCPRLKRRSRAISLLEFIIIKESNSPHQAMQSNIFTGGESLSSSGSGWCCFAYYGGFASIPGWPAERFEHRQVNWRRGIFRTSPGHRFVSPCDQADGPCHRPFYGCHGFHGETSVAQPHGHQGQRPHFPPWCPHLAFRPIWRRR